jgi:6-phosphofructokinase 1
MLGTSRGPQKVPVMVDFLVQKKIDVLFTIGGDGTQKGALEIESEIARRGLKIGTLGSSFNLRLEHLDDVQILKF